MKKLLPIGLLALSIAAVAEQQASAWINSRFGVGLNWGWQSGGNNLLWGLFRDGQPCGPDLYHVEVPVYPRPGCPGAYAPGCMNGMGGPGYGAPGVAAPAAPVPPGAPGLAGPGFAPGFGGPAPAPGFGGPAFGGPGFGGPGFGGPPVAPVSNNGMFNAPEHAIQAPTPPASGTSAQPVSFYRQANYGPYYPGYRYSR